MIGSIVAAAVVLVLLLVFCIRPVSVWYTYSQTEEVLGVETTNKIHFNSFDKMTTTKIIDGKEVSKIVNWYFVKDGVVVKCGIAEGIGAIDKDTFKAIKEEYLDAWDSKDIESEDKWNAFKEPGEDGAVCVGAIVTVAILGVIEVVLAGMAISSVILRKKK